MSKEVLPIMRCIDILCDQIKAGMKFKVPKELIAPKMQKLKLLRNEYDEIEKSSLKYENRAEYEIEIVRLAMMGENPEKIKLADEEHLQSMLVYSSVFNEFYAKHQLRNFKNAELSKEIILEERHKNRLFKAQEEMKVLTEEQQKKYMDDMMLEITLWK